MTLKYVRVNKKEFHKSQQPIDLYLVNVDQIVVSGKFKHSDDGFNYFIGYKRWNCWTVVYYLTSNDFDFVMRMEKKNYPQVHLAECKYSMKKTKMTKFIEVELESSQSQSQS